MRKRGYSDSLSTGVLAAGGTLGILIPPSIILVIYAILAEQNIVKMFVAAIVPGLLAALGYILAVAVYVRVRPDAATTAERVPYRLRMRTLARIWPVVVIFGLVMGGIAADWDWSQAGVQALFTPTEGAAVGAVATGLYGMFTGGLTWKGFLESVLATAQATAMIFFIVWAAKLFNGFLALTRAPDLLVTWIEASGYAPLMVLAIMLVAYLLFGCVMDSLSMILLTIPIFFPIIMSPRFRHPRPCVDTRGGGDLVRRPRADRGRGGADHAARGDESLHHQFHGPRHPDGAHLRGRGALRGLRPDPCGDPRDVSGYHPVAGGRAFRLSKMD